MIEVIKKSNRMPQDNYQTPSWCVDLLLKNTDFLSSEKITLDPFAGSGAILKAMGAGGHKRLSAWEKRLPEYKELSGVTTEGLVICDSLFIRPPGNVQVVTNPPYSIAMECVNHFVSSNVPVSVFLLRLSFLESKARSAWLQRNPPSWIGVLSRRPVFTWPCKTRECTMQYSPDTRVCSVCNGKVGPGTDSSAYAWFAWQKDHKDKWSKTVVLSA